MVSQPTPSTILAISVLLLAFAVITLLLRLISRVHFAKIFGAEDVFIILALAMSACHVTGVIYQVRYGLGTHIADRRPEDEMEPYLKSLFFSSIFYVTGLTLAKISILCLYLRIFSSTRMRKFLYGMLAFIIAFGLWLIITSIIGCVPVQAFWDHTVSGFCFSEPPMWFSMAAINIITDFTLCLSPMFVLRSLRLPRRQKLGLYAVFGVGLFVCITSVVRIPYIVLGAGSADVTWNVAGVALWSGIELNMAIICACLLVMKPLFIWVHGRLPVRRGGTGTTALDQEYDSSRAIRMWSRGGSTGEL